MLILGIESSCDETAAAVCDGEKILSSVVLSQVEEHGLYGGVVPEIASRRHIEHISRVVELALKQAGVAPEELTAVAPTYAPGLIGAVLVGLNFAKGLCLSYSLPLVPVHHLRAHVAALYIKYPELKPPFVAMAASGGHSHLVLVKGHTEFKVLGRTVDDAAGEAFDKVSRTMKLGYPGGPAVSREARRGDARKYSLPWPKTAEPHDVSFSGLKTAVLNIVNTAEMKGESIDVPSLCAAFEERVSDILCDRVIVAASETGVKKAALCGGVSANARLRDKLAEECERRGLDFFVPDKEYCGDNAAMVAMQGCFEYRAGHIADMSQNAYAEADME